MRNAIANRRQDLLSVSSDFLWKIRLTLKRHIRGKIHTLLPLKTPYDLDFRHLPVSTNDIKKYKIYEIVHVKECLKNDLF